MAPEASGLLRKGPCATLVSLMPNDIVYTGAGLDRAGQLRRDDAWIAARLMDPTTRLVPVWRARNLIVQGETPRAIAFSGSDTRAVLSIAEHVSLLGLDDDAAWFAADLSRLDETAANETALRARVPAAFMDLRQAGALMDRREGTLLAYARGIVHWHQRHRFCGACGSPTTSRHGGHMRACTNPACGTEHFPRTDPAVIMLVTRPARRGVFSSGRCLLARQPHWPKGMYSSLAGFVEPGESLEEAVRREVREETGIVVGQVLYRASQPWPFPSSLMLGFRAVAESESIKIDGHELEDARWFTRDEIARIDKGDLKLSRKDSIARWLIEDWLSDSA
jgi:NAD+ diphosphatase